MPFYSYHCPACDTVFETLVRGDDTPACPHCASQALERLPSAAAVQGKTKAALSAVRSQAAREGHFSNYSRSDMRAMTKK